MSVGCPSSKGPLVPCLGPGMGAGKRDERYEGPSLFPSPVSRDEGSSLLPSPVEEDWPDLGEGSESRLERYVQRRNKYFLALNAVMGVSGAAFVVAGAVSGSPTRVIEKSTGWGLFVAGAVLGETCRRFSLVNAKTCSNVMRCFLESTAFALVPGGVLLIGTEVDWSAIRSGQNEGD